MASQLLTKRNVSLGLGGLVSLAAGGYKFFTSFFESRLHALQQQQDRERLALAQEMDRRLLQDQREMSNRLLDIKQGFDSRLLPVEQRIGVVEKEMMRMQLSGKIGAYEVNAEQERVNAKSA